MSASSIIQKKTACNRDCGDACGIVATIEDGRVTRLQGDPDHPVTQGFLCHRTSRFLERQYDPDRITTPLVRKGDGFEPISWDEALERISQSMLRIREESGGAAILHYRCGGSMGLMKSVTDGCFEAFGPITIKSGDICTGAGDHAQNVDFGCIFSHVPEVMLRWRWVWLVFCSIVVCMIRRRPRTAITSTVFESWPDRKMRLNGRAMQTFPSSR